MSGVPVPCERNKRLKKAIEELAEVLKTEAHKLGSHGLSERDFYQSGLFRGAIERVRGQYSAAMKEKRDFVRRVLNWMQDRDFIDDWESTGDKNRHDYLIRLDGGRRIAALEIKGCLDGNNTNIFERPPNADEFVIWSLCTNPGADPRHNVWSGLHTRLSAEIIERKRIVDGVIVWDWICGTTARPCPKLQSDPDRKIEIGPFILPPPCVYLLPGTVPAPRNNPSPNPQSLDQVRFLKAFSDCFGCRDSEINLVRFDVAMRGAELLRTTKIVRGGVSVAESEPTPIRRA